MDRSRLRFMFELIGISAIVLSLVFVALQLKQDQQLTRSELGAGTMEQAAAFRLSTLEWGFHRTFVKMITQPEQLTIEEVAEIDGVYQVIRGNMIRECYLVLRGVFAECENTVGAYSQQFFRNEFAQRWWKLKGKNNPFLPDWVSERIAGLDPAGNLTDLQQLQH